jgi:hypothetical protein
MVGVSSRNSGYVAGTNAGVRRRGVRLVSRSGMSRTSFGPCIASMNWGLAADEGAAARRKMVPLIVFSRWRQLNPASRNIGLNSS